MLFSILAIAGCALWMEKPLAEKEIKEYSKKGILLARKGSLNEAQEILERVLKDDPERAEVKFALGEVYVKLKENKKSINILEEIRSDNSKNPDFHQVIGKAYFQNGNIKQVEEEYKKALAINPNHAPTISAQGEIFKAYGEMEKAEKSFRRALKIDPNLGVAHYNIGLLFEERKKFPKALSEYKVAVNFGERTPDTYYHLGSMLNLMYAERKTINIADYEVAIEALEYLLKKDPRKKETHYLLGVAYLKNSSIKKSSLPKAVNHFKEALNRDSSRADYHYGLGTAYEAGGRIEEAIEEYNKAIELDRNDVDARGQMAALFYKQEKYDQAEQLDQEILRIDPRNFQAKRRLARKKRLKKD
jgi:tetratricopeptide (TPR) repeat protein